VPSNLPDLRQHFLKAQSGAAGAQVVAAEFFNQLFVFADDTDAATDSGFGWEASSALTAPLERRGFRLDIW
jgi:hypothetical protein